MDSFLNPINGLLFIKKCYFDSKRLQRLSPKEMKRYRDKALRKAVRYAYTVPVYYKKYKEAGVNPDDIKGIEDIKKLPFITKKDLINNFPDGIVPVDYNKEKAYVVSTGGSSGNPVSVYTDFTTMSDAIGMPFRQSFNYNFNWRKIRFATMGTYISGRIDHATEEGFVSKMRYFYSLDNRLTLNAFDPIKEIVKKLDEFKPDVILSYPITLQHIAYFKKKGYGKNINPKLLQSGGYSLDEYTKRYIEDAFGCKVVNLYQCVEVGGDVAFECLHGTWHINYDFYHVEVIDENMELVVDPGEKGHIVITRLFGRGTPAIRYTGIDDWVTLVPDHECSCGLRTPIFKSGVEGRISARIILPDGRVFPAASFAIISLVLNDLKTYKVTQFQIVQKRIDAIDILIVIDADLRDVGPSVDLIFRKIEEAYREKCGPDVKISVKEVKEIKSPPGKPLPIVISHVKLEDGYKILDN